MSLRSQDGKRITNSPNAVAKNSGAISERSFSEKNCKEFEVIILCHCAIRRCRLTLYRSKKKPYLNMIQKRRRFLWAKAHLKWTVAKWKTVLWSDETKCEVLCGKLGRHVIRTKEDKDNPSCYQRSVQKPASLMVWGCMSVFGMGSLHIWKGTINAERYIQVLEQHMLPSRCRLFQGRPCIFQHDNARPHMASLQSRSFTHRKHLAHHKEEDATKKT